MINGQSRPMNCGLDQIPQTQNQLATVTNQNCLDTADIKKNCTPIYLSVNVHWFLEDDCTGYLVPAFDADGDDTLD